MAKEYEISKTAGVCCSCNRALQPGDPLLATVIDTEDQLQRKDYCRACWEGQNLNDDPDLLGFWSTRVPRPEEKKKLFVDDEVLMQFFERLDGTGDPGRVSFRFVLTLVLMRKKLLVYEGSEKTPSGDEVWTMRLKGSDRTYQVTDPHMDEEKITEVSQHLSEILESEL